MAAVANDVYRSSLGMLMHGQIYMNVVHWRLRIGLSDSGANSHLAQINAMWGNLITNAYRPLANAQLSFEWIDTVWVAGEGDPHFLITPVEEPGLVSDDPLPGFVSAPIFFLTGLAGRSNRGRFHPAGLSEEDSDGDALSSTGAGKLAALVSELGAVRGSMNNIQTDMVIWSRTKWLAAGGPALENTDPGYLGAIRNITSQIPGNGLGTMYSRRIGRGV